MSDQGIDDFIEMLAGYTPCDESMECDLSRLGYGTVEAGQFVWNKDYLRTKNDVTLIGVLGLCKKRL